MATRPPSPTPRTEPTRRVVLDRIEEVREVAQKALGFAEKTYTEVRGSDDPLSPNRGQRGQIADHEKRILNLEAGQVKTLQGMDELKQSLARIEKKFESGTPAEQAFQANKKADNAMEELKRQEALNRQKARNVMWTALAAVLAAAAAWLSRWPG